MGARWSELWVKAGDVRAVQALARDYEGLRPGAWVRVFHGDFDSEVSWSRLISKDLDRDQVEAVYLATYDGPAAELCGTFHYEHRANGALRRALVYAPEGDAMTRRWVRIEGEPEAWEAGAIAKGMDSSIRYWIDTVVSSADPPLPAPSPEEQSAARQRFSRLVPGEEHPYVNEYVLTRAVHDAVLQPK